MIEADDQYTGEHAAGVVGFTRRVAEALGLPPTRRYSGWSSRRCSTTSARRASRKAILHKPAELTPDEWAVMRLHAQIGADMLTVCGGVLADVAPIVRHHHERFDGGGYPDRLAGSGITARGADPRGLRCLLGDDHRPAVPGGDDARARPPTSCAVSAGRSSTRPSPRCSSACSTPASRRSSWQPDG